MLGVDGSTPIDRRGFTIGYDLGTVGTWVRILVGVVASVALVTPFALLWRCTSFSRLQSLSSFDTADAR
jgi:hypothetical protein